MALTSGALLLQWRAGAFECDFGGHPDEGAHFVTGLMVRDYLVSGIPQHPMRYAETYYAHYPKVALGHYPPGFYALEGAWLAVFPVGRGSVLVLMAALSGTLGTLVFSGIRNGGGVFPAACAGGIVSIVLPLTQTMTATVMSDLLVAIFVLLAVCSFGSYLKRERWIDSLAFGFLAAAATMTKGSGLFLALLPPLAIFLTARYRLLAKGSLWIAVLPVMIICGPWLYFSSGITAEGMVERGVLEHLRTALPYFAKQFVRVFGFAILVPAIFGGIWVLSQRATRRDPFWVVMTAVPVCLVAFYSAIPAGLEPRYLLPLVPSIILLAFAGLRWGISWIAEQHRPAAVWGFGVLVSGLFCWETFTIPMSDFAGYREPVRELVATTSRSGHALKFLVSSDARGEGAFISEVAILDENRPGHTVARSSKVLSKSDWLGRGYQEAFESDEQLLSFLRESSYDGIFVDESIPDIFLRPDHERIARVLGSSDEFVRVPDLPGAPDRRVRRSAVYVRAPVSP